MWNPFKKKSSQVIVLATSSFTKEDAERIHKMTGQGVILARNVDDVRIIEADMQLAKGDGKAEFLGSGTEEEFKDQERKDKFGVKKLFGL